MRKPEMRLLRSAVTKGLSRRVLTGPSKRFVFLYHDISDPDSPQYSSLYSTPVRNFKSQVDLLAKYFKFVPLEEILASPANKKQRLASLTFDDGFLSVKDEALPYLQAQGIPFSVFVNSMAIKDNRLFYGPEVPSINRTYDRRVFLDEDDVKELAGKGVAIGSHSSTHKDLAHCDDMTLRSEVLDNKLYIESLTGTKARHFALPFGKREHYNDRVLAFCYSAGHDYLYSTNPSYFEIERGQRLIPRVAILNESREELLFAINRLLLKKIDI
jgi:peptidoglycan/xylan/chitin deacetylase (PgdA/CDA1 family)